MADDLAAADLESWSIACAAVATAGTFDATRRSAFAHEGNRHLRQVACDDPRAVLTWSPQGGWERALEPDEPRRDLLELYLPIVNATPERPMTVGHLGQSLDGFIATPSGDSCFVTGPQNILHLHRLRALCDAVIVGARTAAADNPRLTTRLVSGSNPLRVILDRECRLTPDLHVFSDGQAPTVRVCAAGTPAAAQARARGENVIEVQCRDESLDLRDLLQQLRERGCSRIFVEGGGVTVSSFLSAGLLDRLHIAVAPLLIGEGRPAIRMPPQLRLKDCLPLRHRVYRSGNDILFDCDLRAAAGDERALSPTTPSTLERIL